MLKGSILLTITCVALSAQSTMHVNHTFEVFDAPDKSFGKVFGHAGKGIKMTLYNNHPTKAMIAYNLKSEQNSITLKFEDDPVKAGESRSWYPNLYHPPYHIDAIMYSDGTVEGPNTWGLDQWVNNYQRMKDGLPVYPNSKLRAESGGSIMWVREWAKLYEEEFGKKPVVFEPAKEGVRPNVYSQMVGFLTVAVVDDTAYPPEATCSYGGNMPSFYDVECGGTGQCTQPNTFKNKTSVFVYSIAQGHCSSGALRAAANKVNTGLTGYPPNYWVADSWAKSVWSPPFTAYNRYTFLTDSCVEDQIEGPSSLWVCPPVGPPPCNPTCGN